MGNKYRNGLGCADDGILEGRILGYTLTNQGCVHMDLTGGNADQI